MLTNGKPLACVIKLRSRTGHDLKESISDNMLKGQSQRLSKTVCTLHSVTFD